MTINLLKKQPQAWKARFSEGFVTRRLMITPFRDGGDVCEMGAGFESPDLWRFSRGIDTPASAAAWLTDSVQNPSCAPFVVRYLPSRELAGFCVLNRWGGSQVELGGWLSTVFWGQGLGREFLKGVMHWMTDARGVCSLVAEVAPENAVATHLLESAGFVRDSGDGYWRVG